MRTYHRRPEPKEGSVTVPIDTQPITVTGTVTIPAVPASTQRGLDAVFDLGLDNTGNFDCADTLSEFLHSHDAARVELHFPPGRYYFGSTVETNAALVKLVGDGQVSLMSDGAVTFCTDQALDALLWFNCTTTSSNMQGPWIENIQFQDVSPGHNVLRSAVRITNTANSELKIGLRNLKAQRVTAGTVSVASQSATVDGAGTSWDTSMAPAAWIVIAGYVYEVKTINSPTRLTLAIPYQGAGAAGLAYGLNWGGIGVWCEPGLGFTQYGKDWTLNGRCSCGLFASAGQASGMYTGTSRIKVRAGYLNGESMADSLACYLGPYSDTFIWDVSMNSFAFGVVVANGHQHDLQHGDYENAGPAPPVSGMPAGYNSGRGILVMGSNSSDCWGNRIGGYFRQVGTAIELYGAAGKAPNYTVLGVCTFRSNKTNFVPGNASNTIGADVYASATSTWDPPPDPPPPCDPERE